jgi:hypothetical protein
MADKGETNTGQTQERTMKAAPVTPTPDTARPEGLAFDVEKGAELPGVPAGDQTPRNPGAAHIEQVVRENGAGVGLAIPGEPDQKAEQPQGDESSEP